MTRCRSHPDSFDDACPDCRQEYLEMMQHSGAKDTEPTARSYKEFDEQRAKTLYQELLLQYIQSGIGEEDGAAMARRIIRRQCEIRNMEPWPWV